ncbi:MAG: amidohydrolase [Bacillota bacterium]
MKNMSAKMLQEIDQLAPQLSTWRRDFHRHAEAAWTEFRTSAQIAKRLTEWGYELQLGDKIIASNSMMGVPDKADLERHMHRAVAQGADPQLVDAMRGGLTGVVATLTTGRPGPTIALRFDIDSNDAQEVGDPGHRPAREGFASINAGAMHACGHDGHAAIGLGLAKILIDHRDELSGTIKLIFQPAEEGVRGAKAMVDRGVVDEVDYLLSGHIGFGAGMPGSIVCGTSGFLATSKFDAMFRGQSAHAGAAPDEGRNALLAAATAALNLHAIPRHKSGASRINVGVLNAGIGRNLIAPTALMKIETRGANSAINDYMVARAEAVLRSTAGMYDCDLDIMFMGSAPSAESDVELQEVVKTVAEQLIPVELIVAETALGGSEDVSFMMKRVQEQGGKAVYVMVGTQLAAGHHDQRFDFDESCLPLAVKLFAGTAFALTR